MIAFNPAENKPLNKYSHTVYSNSKIYAEPVE